MDRGIVRRKRGPKEESELRTQYDINPGNREKKGIA